MSKSKIIKAQCANCGAINSRGLNEAPKSCTGCGNFLVVKSDFVEGLYSVKERVFHALRQDDEENTSKAIIVAGCGVNRLKNPLHADANIEVRDESGARVSRWAVNSSRLLEDGSVEHELKLLEEFEKPPEKESGLCPEEEKVVYKYKEFTFSYKFKEFTFSTAIMLKDKFKIISKTTAPFLQKYGVAIGLFLFGVHLHAEVEEWEPFWDENSIYEQVRNPEGQVVTARWLMLAGIVIWVGVHYGLFERLKPKNEE